MFGNASADPPDSGARGRGAALNFRCSSGFRFPNNATETNITCAGPDGAAAWTVPDAGYSCLGNALCCVYDDAVWWSCHGDVDVVAMVMELL